VQGAVQADAVVGGVFEVLGHGGA